MKKPDQYIGPVSNPHFVRWFLFRSKRFDKLPRLYLHRFYRSDDDRAPHNHPWWFVSVLLHGSYIEHRWIDGVEHITRRRSPSVAFRGLSTNHRIELDTADPRPIWSLILTGPDVRGWGFQCPDRFVPWRQFDGCGEAR